MSPRPSLIALLVAASLLALAGCARQAASPRGEATTAAPGPREAAWPAWARTRAYAGAPADLQSAIADMTFDPVLEVGAAYDVTPSLTVSGDLHNRFGDGLDVGPKFHLGAGAEWRGISLLPLRVGAALITDGVQLGGGASLVLGPVNLSFAGAVRTGNLEDTTIAMFGLSFGSN